jgi:hypothetical protein
MHDTAKRSVIQGLSQKRSVRAVVFDYGNVLCLEQTLEDMKGMALVSGIPHERCSELYWKLRPPYDRGDIDGPAYWTDGCWPARTGFEQRSDSNANN